MTQNPETTATRIHPSAIVDPQAEIGIGVEVGPFCIIEGHVKIGDGSMIHGGAQILGRTTLGRENEIFPGAIVGGIPQDRKFGGEESELAIGDRNKIREHATLHRGTLAGSGVTRIGHDNLLMACCHVAHDCLIEDRVTIGNNSLMAGHVHVEADASISGSVVIHQFVTIGNLSFIGGAARVPVDVPPFLIFEGRPGRPRGLNLVGLKRGDIPESSIMALKEAYRVLFHAELTREEALSRLESKGDLVPEVRKLLEFLRRSEESHRGRYLETLRMDMEASKDASGDA